MAATSRSSAIAGGATSSPSARSPVTGFREPTAVTTDIEKKSERKEEDIFLTRDFSLEDLSYLDIGSISGKTGRFSVDRVYLGAQIVAATAPKNPLLAYLWHLITKKDAENFIVAKERLTLKLEELTTTKKEDSRLKEEVLKYLLIEYGNSDKALDELKRFHDEWNKIDIDKITEHKELVTAIARRTPVALLSDDEKPLSIAEEFYNRSKNEITFKALKDLYLKFIISRFHAGQKTIFHFRKLCQLLEKNNQEKSEPEDLTLYYKTAAFLGDPESYLHLSQLNPISKILYLRAYNKKTATSSGEFKVNPTLLLMCARSMKDDPLAISYHDITIHLYEHAVKETPTAVYEFIRFLQEKSLLLAHLKTARKLFMRIREITPERMSIDKLLRKAEEEERSLLNEDILVKDYSMEALKIHLLSRESKDPHTQYFEFLSDRLSFRLETWKFMGSGAITGMPEREIELLQQAISIFTSLIPIIGTLISKTFDITLGKINGIDNFIIARKIGSLFKRLRETPGWSHERIVDYFSMQMALMNMGTLSSAPPSTKGKFYDMLGHGISSAAEEKAFYDMCILVAQLWSIGISKTPDEIRTIIDPDMLLKQAFPGVAFPLTLPTDLQSLVDARIAEAKTLKVGTASPREIIELRRENVELKAIVEKQGEEIKTLQRQMAAMYAMLTTMYPHPFPPAFDAHFSPRISSLVSTSLGKMISTSVADLSEKETPLKVVTLPILPTVEIAVTTAANSSEVTAVTPAAKLSEKEGGVVAAITASTTRSSV